MSTFQGYSLHNQRLTILRDTVLPYLEQEFGIDSEPYSFKCLQLAALSRNSKGTISSHDLLQFFYPNDFELDQIANFDLENDLLSGLFSLMVTNPKVLKSNVEELGPAGLLELLPSLVEYQRTLLIVAHLGYPHGGGESFLYDNCVLMSELGWKNVWISFLDSSNNWHKHENRVENPFYLDIQIPGPPEDSAIVNLFNEFNPDVVHTHGAMAQVVERLCSQSRIPALIGFHFWTGLIELGVTENIEILQNSLNHKLVSPHEVALAPTKSNYSTRYLASEFMLDVLNAMGSNSQYEVIHPIPNAGSYTVDTIPDATGEKYVLLMNAHPRKGGYLLENLVKKLAPGIKIKAVISESGTEDFYEMLRGLERENPNLELVSYTRSGELYESAKLVIVPSLVDETFGRVVFESVMNGIPVFSSRSGFIPYQLRESGIYIGPDADAWAEAINSNFFDDAALGAIAQYQKFVLSQQVPNNLIKLAQSIEALSKQSPKNNIGIFTIWGDQGLGNQAREYARQIRALGRKVDVLSFQSYLTNGYAERFQQDPDDWSIPEHADSVHYSFNDRENITLHELRQFVLVNNVGTLIVPEICWAVNWNKFRSLKIPNLAIVGVPNIEIVRSDEITFHNDLNANFFPTLQCARVLEEKGVKNGIYLPYNYKSNSSTSTILERRKLLQRDSEIKYLHVAGANPVTRKNTPAVLDAFIEASKFRADISLTVTSLVPIETFYKHPLPENIHVLRDKLSRLDIEKLYQTHDVSIQVSSHEGIGLGFHEATSNACPVISLDVPPHNEIVKSRCSGWLISARAVTMPDNNDSVVSSWKFAPKALETTIREISKEAASELSENLLERLQNRVIEIQNTAELLKALSAARRGVFPSTNIETPDSISFLLRVFDFLSRASQRDVAKYVPRKFRLLIYLRLRSIINNRAPGYLQ